MVYAGPEAGAPIHADPSDPFDDTLTRPEPEDRIRSPDWWRRRSLKFLSLRFLRSLRCTNRRFQGHFNALSTIFLKSAVADFVNSFGPVILTNTLPSLASMMAPRSA